MSRLITRVGPRGSGQRMFDVATAMKVMPGFSSNIFPVPRLGLFAVG